ncbi:MAG: hypothetical protein PHU05_02295 [Bacilli bacterium]|nr:hypothetical protein [Bacilli bacterium]
MIAVGTITAFLLKIGFTGIAVVLTSGLIEYVTKTDIGSLVIEYGKYIVSFVWVFIRLINFFIKLFFVIPNEIQNILVVFVGVWISIYVWKLVK